MTFPTVPPSPPTERPQPPHRSDRFFAWVAGLGVARSDGWIGGVAAGVASRLRIDPLIVRGVLVVTALFGLPMILLYAVAWALLPDPEGRIHLRELLRGRFEPAQLGILAGFLIGMLSVTPTVGLFLVERILNPYSFQTFGPSPFGVLLFLVGLVLVGILLALIVRAARRTPGGASSARWIPEPGPRAPEAPVGAERRSEWGVRSEGSAAQTPPFASAPPGYSGAAATAEIREEDAAAEGASASSLPPEPNPAPADADDLEAWRVQHAAWQQQDQAWRAVQQDAERVARDQARAERQAAAAIFAAEAAERRRIRRASNPRASVAYVATVVGVALTASAIVWLWSPHADAVTVALALFSAALVLGFGMIIAGVARRRSGLLAFLAVGTLMAGLIAGGAATAGNVRFADAGIDNVDGGEIRQPFGGTRITLMNLPQASSSPIVVHKGSGYTEIYVNDGVELRLTATVGADVDVDWNRTEFRSDGETRVSDGAFTGSRQADGSSVYRETVSSPPNPDVPGASDEITVAPVTIEQQSGQIHVVYSDRSEKEATK